MKKVIEKKVYNTETASLVIEKFETVEITEGVNGYPQNLRRAIVCDTMHELNEAETTLKDSGIEYLRCWIRRRAGWQLWESWGTTWLNDITEMPMDESGFYLKCNLLNSKQIKQEAREYVLGEYKTLNEYAKDVEPDNPERRKILKQHAAKFIDEIKTELLFAYVRSAAKRALLYFGRTNEGVCFTVTDQDTGYGEDVYSNKIALILTD